MTKHMSDREEILKLLAELKEAYEKLLPLIEKEKQKREEKGE